MKTPLRELRSSVSSQQPYKPYLKTLALISCLTALAAASFAQGTITFVNNTLMLISVNGSPLPAGAPATFWFTVLTGPANSSDIMTFVPTGAYATNQSTAGRIYGGAGITINNWPAGANRAFAVAGWSSNLGTTFDPRWLTGNFGGATSGFFCISPIVSYAAAGGVTPEGVVFPPLNIFGGTSGLQSGFGFVYPFPEPTTTGLAVLGAAVVALFRRRNNLR